MSIIDDLPAEWFDVDAVEGVVKRHRHPGCSDNKDRALTIIKTKWGWYVSCFRCKQKGFKQAANLPPWDMLKWQQAEQERADEEMPEIKLPGDFSKGIPPAGLAWLYSCGITDKDIETYNIGYSPHRHRIILPVYESGELVYWQGRFLGEPDQKHPKYVNQHRVGRRNTYFKITGKGANHVVVVEDILSCIVVGRVVDCYALLNASVPDRLMFQLEREYKAILLWLDPDKAAAMDKWCLRYLSFGINVKVIKTDQDPKYCDREVIEREIECKN